MNFEEIPVNAFPANARYYFGVTLLNIGSRECRFEVPLSMGISEIWDVSEITSPIPRVIHWYQDTSEDKVREEDILNDVVIEINGREVSWYPTKRTEW